MYFAVSVYQEEICIDPYFRFDDIKLKWMRLLGHFMNFGGHYRGICTYC